MTIAVCYSCGAMKFGALTPCDNCKIMPTDEDDIILSFLLTDRHVGIQELENLSQGMMRGECRPAVDDKTKEAYRLAAQQAQRMLGVISESPSIPLPRGYDIPVPKGLLKKLRHYWLHGWRY